MDRETLQIEVSKITDRVFDIQVDGYDGGEQLEMISYGIQDDIMDLFEKYFGDYITSKPLEEQWKE